MTHGTTHLQPRVSMMKGSVQDGSKLQLLVSTGLHGPIRNNVEFVPVEDDFGRSTEFAVFPVGQQVALYRLDDGLCKFLARVSPCRKEQGGGGGGGGGDKPQFYS